METEEYQELRKYQQEKRWSNYEKSLGLLNENNIRFTEFANGHIKVGDYDFWATTGLYIHKSTKKRGYGIKNLIKLLDQVSQ